MTTTETAPPAKPRHRWTTFTLVAAILLVAVLTVGITYLLTTIIEHRQEEKQLWVRQVDVDENTTDPAQWGKNWPREYDGYLRTVDKTHTQYGGSEGDLPPQKIERDPWIKRMFAGYAFAIDYRDRRGHAYMLFDQEQTKRINEKPQPGACLHCHASVIPTYRRLGIAAIENKPADQVQLAPNDFNWAAVFKGFELMSTMGYLEAHGEVLKTPDGSKNNATPPAGQPGAGATTREALAGQQGQAHPVSCIDCHDPQSMHLRVTRPGFIRGIQALAQSDDPLPHLQSIERWRKGDRKQPYDPNRDASRQEMRSFVCGQCHVEYYCGPKETMFFPWGKGLKVQQIEAFYDEHKFPDGHKFFDWKHAETGAEVIKAQHPEFELWSQGVHARSGVACADCHMPYQREGAMKVSNHHVQSPLLMVNNSCQVCHPYDTDEIKARVAVIQDRTHQLQQEAGKALVDMLDTIKSAKAAGATDEQLAPALALQRKAQWRLDYSVAENSMGFHAPPEAARILAESIDYSRQAQIAAMKATPTKTASTQ
jgi:nitrite reductase (cytochrome c-552)